VRRALEDLRLWTCLLALACFAAGTSAGVLVARARAPEPLAPEAPFDAYRGAFLRRFPLDPRRERLFEQLLRNYEKEIEDARTELLRRSQPELERAMATIGVRYQGYVRDFVLPPERRGEFDALAGQWYTVQ
jgi:hypothetical protein